MIFSAGHVKQVTALCQGGGKKRDKTSTLLRVLPHCYVRQLVKSKTPPDQEREEMGAFGQTLRHD